MKRIIILLFLILATILTACTYSEEDLIAAQSRGYEAGYNDGYEAGLVAKRPIDRPASGTLLYGQERYASEITVSASTDNDYVVCLKDFTGIEYVSFYVRAGDTVTIGVPSRVLYVYFASGKDWYGYGKGLMFGEDTAYGKDDEALDFTAYSYEYTLYPVNNGNFSEIPSNEDEFF